MSAVLVVNAGSSSLKYALVDPASGRAIAHGIVERIGEATSVTTHHAAGDLPAVSVEEPVADHRAAFVEVQGRLSAVSPDPPDVVGHRVVHGGDRFSAPALIDEEVLSAISACIPLAPLHNPAALAGINGALIEYPRVPQVAVFDTAFHATIPDYAHLYALDRRVAADHRIRRFGFHGTSHQYVARKAARFLGRRALDVNLVTLHLGNGASACAVQGGRSVETSMGVTPLEGLVMGTRTGDLDASVVTILLRAGMSADGIDELLNRSSGVLGICGDNDMRAIHRRADAGDELADLARRMFVHRIRKYIGAYAFTLGSVHALVFTAGIGENDWWTREHSCAYLDDYGIVIDPVANKDAPAGVVDVSDPDARVRILIVPTSEEHAIAEQAWELIHP